MGVRTKTLTTNLNRDGSLLSISFYKLLDAKIVAYSKPSPWRNSSYSCTLNLVDLMCASYEWSHTTFYKSYTVFPESDDSCREVGVYSSLNFWHQSSNISLLAIFRACCLYQSLHWFEVLFLLIYECYSVILQTLFNFIWHKSYITFWKTNLQITHLQFLISNWIIYIYL